LSSWRARVHTLPGVVHIQACHLLRVPRTGSVDNTVKVWAVHEDAEEEKSEQVSADSTRVPQIKASGGPGSNAGQVKKIGLKQKQFKLLATFDGHGDTITSVRYHPQGSLAITCSRDKQVPYADYSCTHAKYVVSW